MSAKDMFEELGYELVETNSAGVKLTMIEYYNFETTSTINFWTSINIDIDLQNSEHLTVKHIQAINKQIEELGWNKMKADYVHKDTLTATDYVELNKNNELLMSYNQALLKENQELKKKYENAVADYETTMAEKEQLNSLVNSCQEEIRQLKKQLEEYKKLKEVIDRILNETKETRNILNNNRDDNMLSKSCLLSYLEIVEDLLKEVSE